MVAWMDNKNPKKYKFSLNTLYMDGDYIVKRTSYNNRLYIYIYTYRFPKIYQVLALRVMVHER
jgi:hypothetical protein